MFFDSSHPEVHTQVKLIIFLNPKHLSLYEMCKKGELRFGHLLTFFKLRTIFRYRSENAKNKNVRIVFI